MVYPAKDACDCLEITNVSQACQTLDEDDLPSAAVLKESFITDSAGNSPSSMILRLSHACLPISQIRVPEIGIENVPVYVPVEESDPFRLLHACVPNRLRFVSLRKTTP